MRQGFPKGCFHLFGSRLRRNLRGHVIEVFRKVFGVPAVLTFKGVLHNLGKVALGRHTSGACLRLKGGGILLRQVNIQHPTSTIQHPLY
jgi:hypothetical protein